MNIYKCSKCGNTKTEVIQDPIPHVDDDQNDLCDRCGKAYKIQNSLLEPIVRFFIRIRNWFRSLFAK